MAKNNNINILISKCDLLIKQNKYFEAIALLNEEISSPVYTIKEENEIKKYLKEITSRYNELASSNDMKKMSGINCLKKSLQGEFVNLDLFLYWLENYGGEYNDEYKDIFKWFFINKNYTNENKIEILELLHDYEIYDNFIFLNNMVNIEIEVNSKDYYSIESMTFYKETIKLLENMMNKFPSMLEMAKIILADTCNYFFGGRPDIEIEKFCELIFNFLNISLDPSNPINDDYLKFCEFYDPIFNFKKIKN
jgi:hypothetical protein